MQQADPSSNPSPSPRPDPPPNQLLCGDCLDVLRSLPNASCALIYLDPPFNTNTRRVGETADRRVAYHDSFGTPGEYVAYLRPRVTEMRRVLTAKGSLFFHCDWRMSHHVRLLLDEVFCVSTGEFPSPKPGTPGRPPPQPSPVVTGEGARAPSPGTPGEFHPELVEGGWGEGSWGGGAGVFVNEIIWHYGLGAARAGRSLLTKHDVIYWYANSARFTFHLLRDEPTAAMRAKYRHVDEQGRRYMNSYGKRYLLKGGKPLDDVWDIPSIAPTSAERTGYPTQKPLALLRRIVQLASDEGDTVLDPFCGSGTTLVAAQQLGRNWVGIDANPQAIDVARTRLSIRPLSANPRE